MLGPFLKVWCNGPDRQSELRVSAKVGIHLDPWRRRSVTFWAIDKGRPRDGSVSGVLGLANPR